MINKLMLINIRSECKHLEANKGQSLMKTFSVFKNVTPVTLSNKSIKSDQVAIFLSKE